MSWEERQGRSYYYRKVWRDGTCQSEYIGTGAIADLASAIDQLEALRKEERRREWAALVEREKRLEADVDRLGELVRAAVRVTLHGLGYHRHKRMWRMKRMTDKEKVKLQESAGRVMALVREEDDLTPAQIEELRRELRKHPDLVDRLGNLPHIVQESILGSLTRKPQFAEVLRLQAERMRDEMGYEEAPMVIRMMIDHVVTCWLYKHRAEHRYEGFYPGTGTFKEGEYWDRRVTVAQRRYLRAVESLAKVKMLLSRTQVYQINVAQNQQVVNNQGAG